MSASGGPRCQAVARLVSKPMSVRPSRPAIVSRSSRARGAPSTGSTSASNLAARRAALLGDVGGGDAGVVARRRRACRRPARARVRPRSAASCPANRGRPARAARPAPGRPRSPRCRRRGLPYRPRPSAIATVWRRLNLLCSPSIGAGMLQTRSQLAIEAQGDADDLLGRQPVLARAAGGRIRSAHASDNRRHGI